MADVYRLNAEGKPVRVQEVEELVDVEALAEALAQDEAAHEAEVKQFDELRDKLTAGEAALQGRRDGLAALRAVLPTEVPVTVVEAAEAPAEEAPAEPAPVMY